MTIFQLVVGVLAAVALTLPEDESPPIVLRDGYIGTSTCRACHPDQYKLWLDSDHRHGLKEQGLVGAGEWSAVLESGTKGWTIGANAQHFDAEDRAHEVALADDAILAQRHWTRAGAAFAESCADCHLTDWNAATRDTQALAVSCESCHGPGARHAEWGKAMMMGKRPDDPQGTKGWARQMFGADYASWSADPETGSPAPRDVPHAREQVETCLRCHAANEGLLVDRVQTELAWLDAVSPRFPHRAESRNGANSEHSSFFAASGPARDLDKVAAFATSPMHAAGVACSDCHNQHAGIVYAQDDLLCLRCHEGASFDAPQHHHHEQGKAPTCVDCHMPRDEHGVHDHHLRPPGNPFGKWLGQSDGCVACHADWSAADTAQAIASWRETPRPPRTEYALMSEDAAAWKRVALDPALPALLRAAAARRFAGVASPADLAPLLGHADPLVRLGALRGLTGRDLAPFAAPLAPLASDKLRAIRVEIGRLAAPLSAEDRAALFGDQADAAKRAIHEAQTAR